MPLAVSSSQRQAAARYASYFNVEVLPVACRGVVSVCLTLTTANHVWMENAL